MKLNDLPKTTKRSKKRLGRGYGSGKGGHTTNRGMKGQKSRSSVPIWFEGGQLPFIRRLPFIKGKARFKSLHKETVELNVSDLESLKAGTTVTPKALVEARLISEKELNHPIKILGKGELTKKLTVTLPTSKGAQDKIEAAGGKVESA